MAGEATAAGERAYEHVRVERLEGGVGLLRIDRSERRNALNQATLQELAEAARAFDRDEAVGCLVITGDERAFAAGADVTEMDGKGVPDMLGAYRFESWEALARVRKPIVAAVSGYALGGGLELAMLCDMTSPPSPPSWASPRSTSASCRAPAARSASRASWASTWRWR